MLHAISVGVMPVIFFIVIICALVKRVDIFDAFLSGATEGLKSLFGILPALVGLITAITMLRASGALECITGLLAPLLKPLGLPPEILPLALLRPISGSGSLAVLSDIFTASGPDSLAGRTASVVMGSTETTFYALAVYFGSVKIRASRHTVPAALLADLTGLFAGAWICRIFY